MCCSQVCCVYITCEVFSIAGNALTDVYAQIRPDFSRRISEFGSGQIIAMRPSPDLFRQLHTDQSLSHSALIHLGNPSVLLSLQGGTKSD